MNNEIKEILDNLKDNIPIEEYRSEGTSDGLTHYEEDKNSWQYKLYNCITNLQEENERLKEENKRIFSKVNDDELLISNAMNYAEAQDYKSRCEKAIEYIKYNDSSLYTFEPDYDYEENIVDNYEPSNFREDLLNILNGDDKSE